MLLLNENKINDSFVGATVCLRIDAKKNKYSFLYKVGSNEWRVLKDSVDARFLSTKVAGGFVGCVYAMYATSMGRKSSNMAYFYWFEYVGKHEKFK